MIQDPLTGVWGGTLFRCPDKRTHHIPCHFPNIILRDLPLCVTRTTPAASHRHCLDLQSPSIPLQKGTYITLIVNPDFPHSSFFKPREKQLFNILPLQQGASNTPRPQLHVLFDSRG